MAEQERINIPEFRKKFSTNDACREHPYKIRRPEGLTCPKCGGKDFYKINTRNIYECKCGHRVSLTAATIMHGSRTPLIKWFWAIYLSAHDKRGISALQLHKEIGVSYPTAWLMLHKIRYATGERDSCYLLGGIVDRDETYTGGTKEGGKRGRGTEKVPVEAAVSVDKEGRPQFVKMEMLDDIKGQSIRDFALRRIETGTIVRSDKYSSYAKAFDNQGYIHEPEKFDMKENPEHLKRLRRIVGNLKAFIGGTYHGPGEKHLKAYLSEFCFRINRRKFSGQLFNRLLNACTSSQTITYSQLISPVPS